MRPLTPKMKEILLECHEKELLRQEPLSGVAITQNTKGLVQRGLIKATVTIHHLTGKILMTFFITDVGKGYLDRMS